MSAEVKRVPLDFDWKLNTVWKGYINPYSSIKCKSCDGSGYNPETKQIDEDWYDFNQTGKRWCDNITQDEVDFLIEKDRLWDFTHNWNYEDGWTKIIPAPIVTAEQVNSWNKGKGLGHDSINSMYCVEQRARRLGVFGFCPVCKGEGQIWTSEKVKKLNEDWHDNERYEPPLGDGWQVWETVSEGSPVTPVFDNKDDLVSYLIEFKGYEKEFAENFINVGWRPSGIFVETNE